jgi:hypothetical protein
MQSTSSLLYHTHCYTFYALMASDHVVIVSGTFALCGDTVASLLYDDFHSLFNKITF